MSAADAVQDTAPPAGRSANATGAALAGAPTGTAGATQGTSAQGTSALRAGAQEISAREISTHEISTVWEVFIRPRRGLSHQHVGSVHAADAELALRRARDLYTRRGEGVSIWVVPGGAISASSPDEKDPYFAPAADKVYRHPTFYQLPDGVKNL